MNKKISTLTISYILFLALLFLSGMLSGVLSKIAYLLAGIIPFAFCLLLTRNEFSGEKSRFLTIKKDNIKLTLPLICPTIALIILVSLATSFVIFKLTGRQNQVNIGNSFAIALINHAVLPAVIEEGLFRYLPMRLLSHHSRRNTVFISAFFFALIHRNLFTIPYAFVAGVIFMAIDLATDSVIPSLLLHFINNAISVGIILYGEKPAFTPTIFVVLGAFSILSLVLIILKRHKYKRLLQLAFSDGEKIKFSFEMLIFAGLTLTIAVMNLL